MSSFGFSNGAYNRATGTLNAFGGLSDHLVREGFPAMVSRSGDRELEDQIELFTDRYRQQASGRGKYNDVRIWDGSKHGFPGGTRWVRVSSKGTVAVPRVPPVSNHGKRRSNDLLYPYNNRDTKAHKRAQQLVPLYGITWEGENFEEDWHWTFWGPLGKILDRPGKGEPAAVPKPPAPEPEPAEEEDDMTKNSGALYTTPGGVQTLKIFNTNSGFETHITSKPGGKIDDAARRARASMYDIPSIQEITSQEADVIAASLAEVRG